MTPSGEQLGLGCKSSWPRFPVVVLIYHSTGLHSPLAGPVFAHTGGSAATCLGMESSTWDVTSVSQGSSSVARTPDASSLPSQYLRVTMMGVEAQHPQGNGPGSIQLEGQMGV